MGQTGMNDKVAFKYMMWRKEVFAEAQVDSGTGDVNQI
jgi:hypothetical protein